MARHAARFKITGQLIASALGLPDGTLIYNVKRDDYHPDLFEIIVEHPDLPETKEGGMVAEISPTVEKIAFNWGLK